MESIQKWTYLHQRFQAVAACISSTTSHAIYCACRWPVHGRPDPQSDKGAWHTLIHQHLPRDPSEFGDAYLCDDVQHHWLCPFPWSALYVVAVQDAWQIPQASREGLCLLQGLCRWLGLCRGLHEEFYKSLQSILDKSYNNLLSLENASEEFGGGGKQLCK